MVYRGEDMRIFPAINRLYFHAKQNRWLRYFTVFNRIALAAGFLPAGFVKIMGERFANGLSENHPMGQYLTALHHTGFYYTSIGVWQILAAILLLIPRTATLGAFIYFPIILNICILSLAVRFEGSLITSPLMVLANFYLLCWDYDKLKAIFPFHRAEINHSIPEHKKLSNTFPAAFFAAVIGFVFMMIMTITNMYEIVPRNSLKDCKTQFKDSKNYKSGCDFCDCIHKYGRPLNECLEKYDKTKNADAKF